MNNFLSSDAARRDILRHASWSVPVVASALAVPAMAGSGDTPGLEAIFYDLNDFGNSSYVYPDGLNPEVSGCFTPGTGYRFELTVFSDIDTSTGAPNEQVVLSGDSTLLSAFDTPVFTSATGGYLKNDVFLSTGLTPGTDYTLTIDSNGVSRELTIPICP